MPLWLLLIPYAIFLIIFVIFSLVNLYHAWRFRTGFISSIFLIAFYLAGTGALAYASYVLLLPIDWSQTIGLGSFNVSSPL
jgi:succinate dehydrogenase hydrophobic anchor subunit